MAAEHHQQCERTTLNALRPDRCAAWVNTFVAISLIMFTVVFARVIQLKIAPDARLIACFGSTTSTRAELARRGDLIDRRGRTIASDALGYRLFVDPQLVDDRIACATDIAGILGMNPVPIARAMEERRHSRYVEIDPLLEDWQVDPIRRAGIRGVGLQPRLVRRSMYGQESASLVGFVGIDHTGLSGMENALNSTLSEDRGHLAYLRDARRHAVWIEPHEYDSSSDGKTVRLTIDLALQQFAYNRLGQAVEQFNAAGGRLVVVDPASGDILAMCDILRQRDGWDEQITDPQRGVNPALGRNRCLTDPYEPGSTFKPIVWASATALGYATPDERLDTPEIGPYRTSYGRPIRDTKSIDRATWHEVLIHSLNSGMSIVAERMKHEEMRQSIRRFGFGSETNCGLNGESPGLVTPNDAWSKYTQTSVSFGHEIGVTVVQMARAISVFARDGSLPTLRLIHRSDGVATPIQRVLPKSVVMTTRQAMRDVMTQGTGRRAQSEKYAIFGKSGTPQLPRKEGGGYFEDRYIATFVGAAPFDDPQVVVVCVVDDPDKTIGHYGGVIAGPVVRDVIDYTLEYLGVRPSPSAYSPNLASRE